jgi:hypothetical protein
VTAPGQLALEGADRERSLAHLMLHDAREWTPDWRGGDDGHAACLPYGLWRIEPGAPPSRRVDDRPECLTVAELEEEFRCFEGLYFGFGGLPP